jgi:hypothetical protein
MNQMQSFKFICIKFSFGETENIKSNLEWGQLWIWIGVFYIVNCRSNWLTIEQSECILINCKEIIAACKLLRVSS